MAKRRRAPVTTEGVVAIRRGGTLDGGASTQSEIDPGAGHEARTGLDNPIYPDPALDSDVALRNALSSHVLYFMYQPLMEMTTGRWFGVETLSRFVDRDLLRNATDPTVGVQLELTAAKKALEVAPTLQNARVFLNITAATLAAGVLPGSFADDLDRKIVFEVSENFDPVDIEQLSAEAFRLQCQGMQVAIDSFGSGNWGMREILSLRPDFLKLHRALTTGAADDERKQALIATVVKFADQTGAQIIAAGIERQTDLDALRSLGVHFGQGRLISPPVDLIELLYRYDRAEALHP